MNSLNSISLKENNYKNHENNHQDSNKIATDRLDKEKQILQQQHHYNQQQQQQAAQPQVQYNFSVSLRN